MHFFYLAFAFVIGIVIPLQAAINNQLKQGLLGSTTLAALCSFATGTVALLLVAAAQGGPFRALAGVAEQPLWKLSGGVMGALFVFGTAFLAPRIGLAALLSFVIAGQVLCSVTFDHFGLLGLAQRELSWPKLAGALLVAAGVFMVNFGERWFRAS